MARLRKLIRRTLRSSSPKWAFSVQILNDLGGRVLTLGTQNNLNLIKYASNFTRFEGKNPVNVTRYKLR